VENLVKCPRCLSWLIGEQVSGHKCWTPRYFYVPEIDTEGKIYGWESEDGRTWRKKLVYPSDDSYHPRSSDEDLTEPDGGFC